MVSTSCLKKSVKNVIFLLAFIIATRYIIRYLMLQQGGVTVVRKAVPAPQPKPKVPYPNQLGSAADTDNAGIGNPLADFPLVGSEINDGQDLRDSASLAGHGVQSLGLQPLKQFFRNPAAPIRLAPNQPAPKQPAPNLAAPNQPAPNRPAPNPPAAKLQVQVQPAAKQQPAARPPTSALNAKVLAAQQTMQQPFRKPLPVALPTLPKTPAMTMTPTDIASLKKVKGNPGIVVYNHVQNGVNVILSVLFNQMKKVNQVNYVVNEIFRNKNIGSVQERKQLVERVYSYRKPLLYDRHMYMLNFTNFGRPSPVYINMVRNPIDLMRAMFNFEKAKCREGSPSCKTTVRRYSLDECVQKNMPYCKCEKSGGCMTFIPFFCGTSPSCKNPSQWALDRAIANVKKYYTVVGVSEHFSRFLEVLEKMMPTMFKSIVRFNGQLEKNRFLQGLSRPDRNLKPKLANQTISILHNRLKYDFAFYEFIKQRFYIQYKSVFPNTIKKP